ncbi:MAG: AMP nucleosidase [Proteobacteria bacterium]|nr:AMP nucleosidase [Pseudomonadota bacterium]
MTDVNILDRILTHRKHFKSAREAVNYIHELYDINTARLIRSFDNICSGESKKEINTAYYPAIAFLINPEDIKLNGRLSFGIVQESGLYYTTVTRPDVFDSYYVEQIDLLIENHKTEVMVGQSDLPMPLPFVIDHSTLSLTPKQTAQIKEGFVLPDLSRIDDTIANGTYKNPHGIKPLSLFSAERIDYSLHRLHHYTGTSPDHFQSFILLTNYQRYIEAFINYGKEMIDKEDSPYTALIGPNNQLIYGNSPNTVDEESEHLPQMPTYHLKRVDGQGITFINIGVGPSNAKTITDHLAVLRPHCWIMIGHCAGLRGSQALGDYVLAHAYSREDHVLDEDLPLWIQIPAIAEVQLALQEAASKITQSRKNQIKEHLRTGTIITTDNRNWELQSVQMYERIQQSRAIAVDMESATIAANGFRFRVPYGTLLCVSDKPIHGEIKLQGMANEFYKQRVRQHLLVGLETVQVLLQNGVDQLHSRKLRGFDDPPFR